MADESGFELNLARLARELASALKPQNIRIVFAESCTGGMMAAAMTGVPGISANFCGSAVTYRESTKTQWLSISEKDLDQHTAESEFTTHSMAKAVLEKTPEANFSVAITGHLGPGVEAQIDGLIFVSVLYRGNDSLQANKSKHQLTGSTRRQRQAEAACFALERLLISVQDF